ncbi:MAG: hypothetical protein ACTMIA_13990 [Vibrio sp.]
MRKVQPQGAALLLMVIVILGLMLLVSLAHYRALWYHIQQVKTSVTASQHRWQARAGIECIITPILQRSRDDTADTALVFEGISSTDITRCESLTGSSISLGYDSSRWSIKSQSGQQQALSSVILKAKGVYRLAGSYYE